LPKPALRGAVQYENAAACLAAAEALAEWLPIEPARLGASLVRVTLAGRLQSVWRDGVEWVFDVAHNPEAAAVLAGELRAVRPPGRTLAIVGLMADKDIRGVLEPMSGLIDAWWVTRAATERASEAAVIAAVLGALGCDAVQLSADVHAACKRAQADAGPGDRVVVFGSFYIVGPALSALEIY
jgi:dihydrofolate synthase/folylpolyglutamate synthase